MAKKIQLGYKEIEARLSAPLFPWNEDGGGAVGYNLLHAFGKSERDIARYREGKGVLKTFDGLLVKGLFCFRAAATVQLTAELERLKQDPQVVKAAPKLVCVSDGQTLLAYDLRERDTYENRLDRVCCDFAFFYPLMDVERVHYVEESPADVKAAERLAKLHDELRAYNEFRSDSDLHDLNIFITRLLFCFFAEDTGIFEENLFTASIMRYTKPDGSDLADYLARTFNIMDVSLRTRETLSIIRQFPYVNGGLFSRRIQIPLMGAKARRIIIECGELDWKDINPDIFGSMIQAVVNPEERASQGMHYTSVPNIMKVISPLFLDELRRGYNELNEFYEQKRRMKDIGAISARQFYDDLKPVVRKGDALLKRMSRMKFFDPACGSGNFLIITYKSLRFLEMDILSLQRKCTPEGEILFVDNSVVSLSQFYGIELLDFPHEVAMLSLWLAEHQMNRKLNENFGINTRALPLKNITQIVCGNACRLDWNTICPHTADEEVFVFGNPPYLGTKWQEDKQKEDVDIVMPDNPTRRTLDYISCWFVLGANFIHSTKAKYAFVSTNSICQGEQVAALWPIVSKRGVSIEFCHTSFKWENNAKYNAGVTCVIIGLANTDNIKEKFIYSQNKTKANNINFYLLDAPNVFVEHRSKPLSDLPQMTKGSQPTDGGNLLLNSLERQELLDKYPFVEPYIKQYMGADDLINGKFRYCLWLKDCPANMIEQCPEIVKRLEKVRKAREDSTKEATRKQASTPHLFTEDRQPNSDYLILPVVSSERRTYVPIAYNHKDIIANTNAQMIPNASTYTFGVVTSLIHNVWMRAVAGRMRTDYAYSASIVYNTFPFPKITEEKKKEIEQAAEDVLVTREFYPERTLAELYDPDKMPQDLREAHARLDDIMESCYPGYPFQSDEARLEQLFKMYERMTKK